MLITKCVIVRDGLTLCIATSIRVTTEENINVMYTSLVGSPAKRLFSDLYLSPCKNSHF